MKTQLIKYHLGQARSQCYYFRVTLHTFLSLKLRAEIFLVLKHNHRANEISNITILIINSIIMKYVSFNSFSLDTVKNLLRKITSPPNVYKISQK